MQQSWVYRWLSSRIAVLLQLSLLYLLLHNLHLLAQLFYSRPQLNQTLFAPRNNTILLLFILPLFPSSPPHLLILTGLAILFITRILIFPFPALLLHNTFQLIDFPQIFLAQLDQLVYSGLQHQILSTNDANFPM